MARLTRKRSGLAGLEEDDDVAAVDVAVEGEGHPLGRRSEGDAVDEDVVADEQGLLHGAEGISKFWKMKVMTKRPTASTLQMEARDSRRVSFCSSGTAASAGVGSIVLVVVSAMLRPVYRGGWKCT